MRLFGRIAAADLEARNLRLLFNQPTAAITGMPRMRKGNYRECQMNGAYGLRSGAVALVGCTSNQTPNGGNYEDDYSNLDRNDFRRKPLQLGRTRFCHEHP